MSFGDVPKLELGNESRPGMNLKVIISDRYAQKSITLRNRLDLGRQKRLD
jgi:hypothetical protein